MYYSNYIKVAKRRKKAASAAKKISKKGDGLFPIEIEGRSIAKTFWGKAWCKHLESFGDMANRLPRGRSYVRSGAVIHLEIAKGIVSALVQGSHLYKVNINIAAISEKDWCELTKKCSGGIGSAIELLQGKISSSIMTVITDRKTGLFPSPKEINFGCSCPDSAMMCKHIAAVIYGIGSRLDTQPELLFVLRNVDHLELIKSAVIEMPTKNSGKAKIIRDQDLSALFGVSFHK